MKTKTQKKVLEYVNTGIFPAGIMFSMGRTPDELYQQLIPLADKHWALGLSYHLENVRDGWDRVWGMALSSTSTNKKTLHSVDTFYIVIKDFSFSDTDYTKLAHEVVHICQYVLPDLLKRDKEHEAEAYLHTHIMTQILEHIRDAK